MVWLRTEDARRQVAKTCYTVDVNITMETQEITAKSNLEEDYDL